MALGNTNNPDSKLIILTPKVKDANDNKTKPYFSIADKVNGEWVTRPETTDRFSGTLEKFSIRSKEFKKDGKVVGDMKFLDVFITDGDERYLASFSFKISTRGLMNRLLNLKSQENVQISFWQDDRGYEVLTLRQNDEVVKGKYSKEEIPVPTEVKIRGQVQRDYYEVDQFFIDKINEFSFKSVAKKEKAAPAPKKAPVEAPTEQEESDDIPF